MTPLIVIIILALDQSSKFLATKNLLLNHPIPVIKGIVYLTLVQNRGAAFGILKGQIFFFIFIALIVLVLIFLNFKNNRHKQSSLYLVSLSLIFAGGLGNLIDRIFFGYVIDFIDFRIWPVFNIADSAITIGAFILGWTILFTKNASRNL